MHRLLAAALTCVFAALLAVGAGVGIVAMLNADAEQPNVPLVHFPDHEPDATSLPTPSSSPSESTEPSAVPDGAEGGSTAPEGEPAATSDGDGTS